MNPFIKRSFFLASLILLLMLMGLTNLKAQGVFGEAYITYTTRPNSANEWAADMEAHHTYTDTEYRWERTRWFIRAQFTNNQWLEYTWGFTGEHNEYLTIEQLYGYSFDVYVIVEFVHSNNPYETDQLISPIYTINYPN